MSDAFRPIIRSSKLDSPPDYTLHTVTRRVTAEKELPTIGASAATEVAGVPGIILSAGETPHESGGKTQVFTCGLTPSGHTEYESYAFIFPPIYPELPGGSRSFYPGGSPARPLNVLAQVEYAYSTSPATWLNDATFSHDLTTGPFQVKSVMAQAANVDYESTDGTIGQVGDWLNPFFVSQNTLNDSLVLNITSEGLFYTIDASIPSAATYAGWVAAKSQFIAERTVTRWRGPIYRRRTVKVRAQ